ncbi:hypothetical protein MAUB1S_11400 [Mycolicibacterium aubagnense]
MADGTETAEAEGFEWMMVEIFGHRSHWGRGKEVERFGSKMLRIDVPQVLWSMPSQDEPNPKPVVTGWVTHFYGGSAIFSNTLTDEETAIRRNAPYTRPGKFLPASSHEDAGETPAFEVDRSHRHYDDEYPED